MSQAIRESFMKQVLCLKNKMQLQQIFLLLSILIMKIRLKKILEWLSDLNQQNYYRGKMILLLGEFLPEK